MKNWKRVWCFLLAMVMVVSLLPAPSYAEETKGAAENSSEYSSEYTVIPDSVNPGEDTGESTEASEESGEAAPEESAEGTEEESSEAPQEESSEAAQEESGEAAQEESSEATQDESSEAPQEESSEVAQEESGEAAQEESSEVAQEEPSEAPQEESSEAVQEESSEAPRRRSATKNGKSSGSLDLSALPGSAIALNSQYSLLRDLRANVNGQIIRFSEIPATTYTTDGGEVRAQRVDSESGVGIRVKEMRYLIRATQFDWIDDYNWETDILNTRDTDDAGQKRGKGKYSVTYELFDAASGEVLDTKDSIWNLGNNTNKGELMEHGEAYVDILEMDTRVV